MRFVLLYLRPGDMVLDIGAGAGHHAVYHAEHVAPVVAVEPSPSMRQQMERRLAEAPDMSAISSPHAPTSWWASWMCQIDEI